MRKHVLVFALLALVFLCGTAFGQTVTVKSGEGMGNYLADSRGMTLYYFKKDSPGKSACKNGCLERWPAFYAGKITAPAGIDPKEFGTITRDNGGTQTTFRDYPLYYFIGDKKPGDVNGQGLGNVWYAVDPDTFMK